MLTLSGDTLFLEDGGSVVLPYDIDSLFTDELQQLQISGLGDIKDLTITDGNTIQFSIADNDNDSINEIQGLAEVLSVDSNAAGMNIVNVNSLTIGADTVDSNIALNVQSTTAGAIFSAMTKIQRLAIGSPNEGLIVTQIDEKKGLYMFINGSWVRFKTSGAEVAITCTSVDNHALLRVHHGSDSKLEVGHAERLALGDTKAINVVV